MEYEWISATESEATATHTEVSSADRFTAFVNNAESFQTQGDSTSPSAIRTANVDMVVAQSSPARTPRLLESYTPHPLVASSRPSARESSSHMPTPARTPSSNGLSTESPIPFLSTTGPSTFAGSLAPTVSAAELGPDEIEDLTLSLFQQADAILQRKLPENHLQQSQGPELQSATSRQDQQLCSSESQRDQAYQQSPPDRATLDEACNSILATATLVRRLEMTALRDQSRIKPLEVRLVSEQSDNEGHRRGISQLKDEIDAANSAHKQDRSDVLALAAVRVQSAQDNLAAERKKGLIQGEEVTRLRNDSSRLTSLLDERDEELKKLKEKLRVSQWDTATENAKARGSNTALQQTRDDLAKAQDELRSSTVREEQRVREFKALQRDMMQAITARNDLETQHQHEIEDHSAKTKNDASALLDQMSKREAELQEARNGYRKYKHKCIYLEDQNGALTSSQLQAESDKLALESRVTALQAEIKEEKRRNKSILSLKEEINRLIGESRATQDEHSVAMAKANEKIQELEGALRAEVERSESLRACIGFPPSPPTTATFSRDDERERTGEPGDIVGIGSLEQALKLERSDCLEQYDRLESPELEDDMDSLFGEGVEDEEGDPYTPTEEMTKIEPDEELMPVAGTSHVDSRMVISIAVATMDSTTNEGHDQDYRDMVVRLQRELQMEKEAHEHTRQVAYHATNDVRITEKEFKVARRRLRDIQKDKDASWAEWTDEKEIPLERLEWWCATRRREIGSRKAKKKTVQDGRAVMEGESEDDEVPLPRRKRKRRR